MKVLHINCNYLTTALHQNMIRHLNKYVENVVFVPTRNKSERIVEIDDNVIIGECLKKIDRVFYFYKQKKILNSIEKNITNVGVYDCIHAYTLFTDGNVAMKLSKKYNIPYVVAIRDTDINIFLKYKKYLIPLANRILNNASAIFFLSSSYKEYMFKKYIVNKDFIEKKTYIIPNGIDDFWLTNVNNKTTRKNDLLKVINVIYVGRISKRKNIIATQKALKILRSKGYNIKYTIIGNIDDKNEFRKVMKYPHTNYIGALQKEQIVEYYGKNDIFIMPSHRETFGLVYAEAMSQGLPVIYTKNQGFDGQFKEGIVGYHVPDNKPNEISNAIIDIINNYDVISNNCTIRCRKFDWNFITKKYSEIYESILK